MHGVVLLGDGQSMVSSGTGLGFGLGLGFSPGFGLGGGGPTRLQTAQHLPILKGFGTILKPFPQSGGRWATYKKIR